MLIKPIVLTDGTTPRTFNPKKRVGNQSTFMTDDKSTRLEEATLKINVSENSLSQRVIVKLDEPQTHLTEGVVVVDEHALGEVNIRIPLGMSDTARASFVKRLYSAIDDALVASVSEAGESIWG